MSVRMTKPGSKLPKGNKYDNADTYVNYNIQEKEMKYLVSTGQKL